jgi:hypothetical protein
MNDYKVKLEKFIKSVMGRLKGFKTIIFTVATAVFALMETLDLTGIVTKENMPYVIIGLAIINGTLRAISNTPIGKNR